MSNAVNHNSSADRNDDTDGEEKEEEEVEEEKKQLLAEAPTPDRIQIYVEEAVHPHNCASCKCALDHQQLQPCVIVEYKKEWSVDVKLDGRKIHTRPRLYFHLMCFRNKPKKLNVKLDNHSFSVRCNTKKATMK